MVNQNDDIYKKSFARVIDGVERIIKVIKKFREKKKIISKVIGIEIDTSNSNFPFTKLLEQEDSLVQIKNGISSILEFKQEHELSLQFKNFMQQNFVLFDPNSMSLLQTHVIEQVINYLDRYHDNNATVESNDISVVRYIKSIPAQYVFHCSLIENIYRQFKVFYQIRDIKGSIVMIGANGSGKSTLARQLNNKISNSVAFISAQHFLYYHDKNVISVEKDSIEKVRSFQSSLKNATDSNFQQTLISDMDTLVNALVYQHLECCWSCYDNNLNKKNSFLNKTIHLWSNIIGHRELFFEQGKILVRGEGVPQYEFNMLSDGEKAVFYYIGHVLLAQKNSYIVIDEPENHLHLSICNKLWDALEKERNDCKFLYITHNLALATTRCNCTIIWNKKFCPPYDWDFDFIPKNSGIPDLLLMEILGSRSKILFCEGNESSIDYRLYSILFHEYTVVPVGGHRNVINYVCALNSSIFSPNKAVGIIDKDYHLATQIENWKSKKIFTLLVNEIENILCDQKLLEKAKEHFYSPYDALDDFYNKFWSTLSETKEEQATNYVSEWMNNRLSENFLNERKNIKSLREEIHSLVDDKSIMEKYSEIIALIENMIENKNYSDAIKFVNYKRKLTNQFTNKIVDHYEERVLGLLKEDDELQKYIKDYYFSEFLYFA